jgi:hypothetical protein
MSSACSMHEGNDKNLQIKSLLQTLTRRDRVRYRNVKEIIILKRSPIVVEREVTAFIQMVQDRI